MPIHLLSCLLYQWNQKQTGRAAGCSKTSCDRTIYTARRRRSQEIFEEYYRQMHSKYTICPWCEREKCQTLLKAGVQCNKIGEVQWRNSVLRGRFSSKMYRNWMISLEAAYYPSTELRLQPEDTVQWASRNTRNNILCQAQRVMSCIKATPEFGNRGYWFNMPCLWRFPDSCQWNHWLRKSTLQLLWYTKT